MAPKVLISDKMSPLAEKLFRERGLQVDVITGQSKEELLKTIGDYDGLAIRSSTTVDPDVLAAAKNLKVVGRAGIGVDNVDLAASSKQGVVVMNTPFGNAITTAEHALSLMMALVRQIPQADRSTHAGKWEKSAFMGTELYGKTLGIIGCGNIGSIVADRALGLKMKVIAADPYLSDERALEIGVEKVSLEDLYARSDVISLHTPLTDTTRGIINTETLNQMKDGVYIVNCARGALLVEEDLLQALDSGKVAGAAVDVYANEPAKEHPFFGHDKIVCTPHLGASTLEAQENVAIQVAEQIADYLLTGAVTNALNMPSVSAEDAPKLQPYMALCKQLGALAGQVTRTAIKSVSISYEGHAADLNLRPLTAVILEGLFSPLLDSVNMVNAPLIAKERKIIVSETRTDDCSGLQTRVSLTVQSENGSRSFAGTLFGNGAPRILAINDVPVEAELGENMLYVTNDDKPGFIGALGTLLGNEGVNIATFNLGRHPAESYAIALLHVDGDMPAALLEKVQALPFVRQAQALTF